MEHTADAKFQAYGETLEEAFSNAGLAMFAIITEPEKIKPIIEHEINVEANDNKALLYDFLEELLLLLETEFFLLHEVKELTIEGTKLCATVVGDKISPQYGAIEDIKAVTYAEMEIEEEPGKAMVQVVIDL